MRFSTIVLVWVLIGSGLVWAAGVGEKTLLVKKTPYATVVVTQDGPLRLLKFRDAGLDVEQSRCDTRRPEYLYHEYNRLQLLGLLFPEQDQQILVVGLGGASLTKALARYLPESQLDSVELDPLVVEVARRYFFYQEGPRVRTIVGDARAYLEKTSARYDLIYLDAFDGLEIPEPLRSQPFYELCREHLKPGGAVVANIHLGSHLRDSDRNTLGSVFNRQYSFLGTGLEIVVCQNSEERRDAAWVEKRAQELQKRWKLPYSLPKLAQTFQNAGEWDHQAPVLTTP